MFLPRKEKKCTEWPETLAIKVGPMMYNIFYLNTFVTVYAQTGHSNRMGGLLNDVLG